MSVDVVYRGDLLHRQRQGAPTPLQLVCGHVPCHAIQPRAYRTAAPLQPRHASPGLRENLGGEVERVVARAEAHGEVTHDLGVVGTEEGLEVALLAAERAVGIE